MLTYMLIVALTNLVMGIVLGYFYGPLFVQAKLAVLPHANRTESPTGHATESPVAQGPSDASAMESTKTVEASTPKPSSAPAANSEDLRPIKPTGSREVTALDLADVMSELGVESPTPAAH